MVGAGPQPLWLVVVEVVVVVEVSGCPQCLTRRPRSGMPCVSPAVFHAPQHVLALSVVPLVHLGVGDMGQGVPGHPVLRVRLVDVLWYLQLLRQLPV